MVYDRSIGRPWIGELANKLRRNPVSLILIGVVIIDSGQVLRSTIEAKVVGQSSKIEVIAGL